MKQIYTKTGDEGRTSLRGGERVDKDDLRIEVNGEIDHLNSLLGVVRATGSGLDALVPDARLFLLDIQRELMVVMSHVATPDGAENPRTLHVEELTQKMEAAIDLLAQGRALGFVVPGENPTEAFLHLARTQARTVERRLWALHRLHPLPASILVFFNRLSDYLFALALQTGQAPDAKRA